MAKGAGDGADGMDREPAGTETADTGAGAAVEMGVETGERPPEGVDGAVISRRAGAAFNRSTRSVRASVGLDRSTRSVAVVIGAGFSRSDLCGCLFDSDDLGPVGNDESPVALDIETCRDG